MKARLNQWGFNALAFCLVVLAYVANLVPEPAPAGRHRGVGRATRASHRQLRADREIAAYKRRTFVELSKETPSKVLVWDGDVGLAWMDEFDVPPVPQRRFRALAPRALAASAISAREALRRDQEKLDAGFTAAVAMTKEAETNPALAAELDAIVLPALVELAQAKEPGVS